MTTSNDIIIRRALISVSDKTGIVEFARVLAKQQVEILSTGGTFRLLKEQGIEVKEVSQHTQFPEMMDGRVKTLHPKIHGGILARREQDEAVMKEHGIAPIDLVIVNLYPFEETIAQAGCTLADAIENIDIGGPTMVRSSAKNHQHVAIVVNPSDYPEIINEFESKNGALSFSTRQTLATQAFEHTAAYDGAIANYLGKTTGSGSQDFPRTYNMQFHKKQEMRYGENPHQKAAFYVEKNAPAASIASAEQLQGKALSFNNVADTDAALETVKLFDMPACVIVKHANPCGVAQAESIELAYQKAFATDPESAFGGIIAFNRELDAATAQAIVEKQFVEVIIAPCASTDATAVLAEKKNIRLLVCGPLTHSDSPRSDYKRVNGGLLVQDCDLAQVAQADWQIASKRKPTEQESADMLFAWKVGKMVKSNAIIYAKNNQTIGFDDDGGAFVMQIS